MARWRHLWFIAAGLALLVFALGSGCSSSTDAAPAPTPPAFDSTRAWNDLKAQVAFGPRVPGTDAHIKTRDWLVDQLKPTAASVTLQPFSKEINGKTINMWNIIAAVPGNGAVPREKIVLCAHWDTRPTADQDPDPAKITTPIDGASDGASGVAVLLEIARQLKAKPIARDVSIVLFDGEDYGPEIDNMLLGAKYYAAHLPAQKPKWGILLDMVGDKNLDIPREPYSEEHAKVVNDRIFGAARKLNLLKTDALPGFVDSPYRYTITDDHTPMNEAGVPTIDLIDFNYPPWHTTGDTVDKCSADSLRIVGQAVLYGIAQP